MLVALGLLLLNATAVDLPTDAASDPLSFLDRGLEQTTIAAVTDLTSAVDPGESESADASPGDGHAATGPGAEPSSAGPPQALPESGPVMPSTVPGTGLHVGLPCLSVHGDLVSAVACPGNVFQQPRAVGRLNVSENASASLPGPGSHAFEALAWAGQHPIDLQSWTGPFPPAPTSSTPSLEVADPDKAAGNGPLSPADALAWVGRAAVVLAPTLLLVKLLALAVKRRQRTSPARDVLLRLVDSDPGIHHMELVRRSGLGNGTVQHHLRNLVEEGRVVRVATTGHTCFFPVAPLDPALVQLRTAVRSPVTRQVLEVVAAGPRSLSAVSEAVGLPVSTVHYHVGKLVRAGALVPERVDGRRGLGVTPLGRTVLGQQADVGVAFGQM